MIASTNPYFLSPESRAELDAEIQKRRELLATKRAERVDLPLERRVGDRRGVTDRRVSNDALMAPTLYEADAKHREKRFTGELLTNWGDY